MPSSLLDISQALSRSSTTGLSEYELQRLANIEANQNHLHSIGLDEAAAAVRRQPQKRAKKPSGPPRQKTREQPARTRRSAGSLVSLDGGAIDAKAEAEARAGGLAWELPSDRRPVYADWVHVKYRKYDACTPAERAALKPPDSWLEDFQDFWLREGNSDDNRKQVMGVVNKLVAGEGLNAKKFPELGTFLGGVKVDLHADFDELLAQAHAFLPMKSMPAWMQGKYPPAPAGRPRDASNGWFANHPLQKLQYYQAFLRDQAAEAAAAARAKAKEPKKKQPKAAKRPATPPAEEDDEEDRPLKKKKSFR